MSFDVDGNRALLYPMDSAEAYYLTKFADQISAAGYDVRIDTRGSNLCVQIPLVKKPKPQSNGIEYL